MSCCSRGHLRRQGILKVSIDFGANVITRVYWLVFFALGRVNASRDAIDQGIGVRLMKKHQRQTATAQELTGIWVGHAVHSRYPAIIGPLRHHVANIHHKGAWFNAYVLPVPTFCANL